MKEHFSTLRKFDTLAQAEALVALLEKGGIHGKIGDNIPAFDISFSGNTLNNQYEVKVAINDFARANAIIEEEAENIIAQIDKDYYLFEFSDEELYEILIKQDEWGDIDYTLAQQILQERGKPIDDHVLSKLRDNRLEELAKPDKNQISWIVAGYLGAFICGILGILLGYLLWKSKKSLPNGLNTYSYSAHDRKHGKYIFYIGIIIFPLTFLLRAMGVY